MVGGGELTVRVTFITCGEFVAPGTETVIVYAPGNRLALFTETVSVASPTPLAGFTESQAGEVVSAIAVQFIVPPPLPESAIVWSAGLLP
jgi:hypothetical protein